ncbi:MAG: M16 family metallopeptidase [Alphaproteobacteria bacterium]
MKYNPSLHRLSNGVSVIFDPMDLETTDVTIRFNTGSRDEKPNQHGITHFAEHIFCCGTHRFPNRDSIKKYLKQNGISCDAMTGVNRLSFVGTCLPDKLGVLIDFLSDQLSDSMFDPEHIEKERGAILDERNRSLDKDDTKYNDLVDKELFGNTNTIFCSKNIGPQENIKRFTREELLFFIKSRLSANNCTIIISGKIENPEQTLQLLEEKFTFLKQFDVHENTDIKYTPAYKHLPLPGHNNTQVNILFPMMYPVDKEHEFQNTCIGLMGSFVREKLQKCLRYDNSLVYGITNILTGNDRLTLNGVRTQTSPDNIEKCVALIAQTCADIYYNNTMTQEDLDSIKIARKLNNASFLDNRSKRSERLLYYYRRDGELYDFYSDEKMEQSVTLEDLIKYTRGMFDEKNISILTTGADYNCDLMAIWRKNFKPTKSNVLLKSMNVQQIIPDDQNGM